jgi:hypothetical protein
MSRAARFGLLLPLLTLAALLSLGAEASVPRASDVAAPVERFSASALESPLGFSAPASTLDLAALERALVPAADVTEAPLFTLGDVVLAETERHERFGLGPLTLVDVEARRGPPPSYPETRIRAFAFLGSTLIGVERGVSLDLRPACARFSLGLAEGDVVNLYAYVGLQPHAATDPMGTCAGLDNVPCWDYAKELWKVPFQNVRDFSVGTVQGAGKVLDFATGGTVSGLKKGYEALVNTSGSSSQRLGAAGEAMTRGQLDVMSLGFSEASDKLQHASNLLGTGAISRGYGQMFDGALEGDWVKATQGFGEFAGGVGQLTGIAATAYAPFAPTVYPGNRGFVEGAPKPEVLSPGTVIDRYGAPSGKFASPEGTPLPARSLPRPARSNAVNTYVVKKPIPVGAGPAAPAFRQPGGGIQYDFFPNSLQTFLDNGSLAPVPPKIR